MTAWQGDPLRRLTRAISGTVLGHGNPDLATEEGRSRERDRRTTLTSVAGIATRLMAAAISLVMVPVLLNYLGIERYGVWLTISAGAAWLSLVQFGLAPSLINRLSGLDEANPEIRGRAVSTAFWLVVVLGLIALLPLGLLWNVAPWHELFNVTAGPVADDARTVTAVVWIGLAVGLPLGIPVAILRARQEGYVANLWDLTSAVVRLALVLIAVAVDVGMVGVAAAATIGGMALNLVLATLVFVRRAPDLLPKPTWFDRAVARGLLSTGLAFTGLGIAAIVISYTDVIVITHVLGPASVPTYAIAFSLLSLFVGLELAILDAAWPAYAEATARGDRRWLERTHWRITRLFVLTSGLFALALLVLGQAFIRMWAGPDVVPPSSLLVTLAVLAMVQAYQLPHGRVLTALGHVRINTLLGFTNAAINLPLSIVLAAQFGITGVAVGTLVGYTVVGAILVPRARAAISRVPTGASSGHAGGLNNASSTAAVVR